tara:strand:- start:1554 stop:2096 length:543 start_codon:yes stop_codon:yes gene_type:complete
MRITKVTTKTGDSGETGLGNGERVSKNNIRVHAMGSIDKLNSIIGWTRTLANANIDKTLGLIQQDLFNIGGELAIPEVEMNLLEESRLEWLDMLTDQYNEKLPPLDEFILPGGNEFSSRLHISRAECRETERTLIGLSEQEYVSDLHKKYLNRLSDLFFVIARIVMSDQKIEEISWDYNK